MVRPDLVVICYPDQGDRLTRVPEIIFEVVSPRTSRRDEVIKFDLYEREAVPSCGLAYPEAHKVTLYQLSNRKYVKAGDFHDQSHRFHLSKCTLDVDFSNLWPAKGRQAPRREKTSFLLSAVSFFQAITLSAG